VTSQWEEKSLLIIVRFTILLTDLNRLPKGTGPPGPSSRPEYKGKRLVALKRMKKAFEGGWDECMKLKELKVG